MSMKPLKILALTIGLAGGLGVIGWSQMPGPSANAQQGKAEMKSKQTEKPLEPADTRPTKEQLDRIQKKLELEAKLFEQRVDKLNAEKKQVEAEAARQVEQVVIKLDAKFIESMTAPKPPAASNTGNFLFEKVQGYSPSDFTKYLEKHAAEGHQFVSQVTLKNGDADTSYWMFHKLPKTKTIEFDLIETVKQVPEGKHYTPIQPTPPVYRPIEMPVASKETIRHRDEMESLRSQVESLKEQLAKGKQQTESKGHVTDAYMTTLTKEELSAAGTYVETMNKLRFNGKLQFDGTVTANGIQIRLSGPKEACDWAKSILQPAPAEKPKK